MIIKLEGVISVNIDGKTKLICLLGHPVSHSFSPSIHNYLISRYKRNNVYVCFDVKPEKLEDVVSNVKTLKMQGCNVTIPHKVDVMKYLDEIDEKAKIIGAVNTIKNEGGVLKGYNTDGIGFVKSVLDKGYTLKDKKVMILGAGGACRSIAIEMASNNISSLQIRNRSKSKAEDIIKTVKKHFNISASYSIDEITKEDLKDIDILINTTPIGMETDECPIDDSINPNPDLLVCDIVYKPHETRFIRWAKDNNLDVVYGINMLINQGLHAFYIWTGIKADNDDVEYIKSLYEKSIK